jgi:putative phosphonate metabolism protein
MTPRYAIYFAPRLGEALRLVGNAWLGRDAESGALLPQPAIVGISTELLHAVTAAPRHYGLHATLKPPFRLAPRLEESELRDALASFAARRPAIQIDRMSISTIGTFLALVPASSTTAVSEIAAQCVRHFDRFRAAPLAEETAQRLAAGLTPRQQVLVAEWGYPYVLDEYRFHITLTERIADNALRQKMSDAIAVKFFGVLQEPVRIADLCLFAQTDRREPFRIIDRYPLLP